MRKMIFAAITLICLSGYGQEPEKTAKEEAKEERAKEITTIDTKSTATRIAIGAVQSPLSIIPNLIGGAISLEIKKAILNSEWQMNMTQKFASKGIANFLTKRYKEEWTATNSKIEGKMILTLQSKIATREMAEFMLVEEPLWKWRKCGWDFLVFSNDKESWSYETNK